MQTGKADAAVLDEIATTIERELSAGKNVLVHCVHAHERSPLAIMWYLAWREGLLLEIAHARVAAKHPSTENRLKWVQGLNPCRRMSPQSTVDHPKTGVQSETTAPEEAVMPPDS
jgi:hypothetical protein